MKEIIKEIIEFDLDEGRMDYLDDMIDVFSKDGCEMVDILFDRFLKKYYVRKRNGQRPDPAGNRGRRMADMTSCRKSCAAMAD